MCGRDWSSDVCSSDLTAQNGCLDTKIYANKDVIGVVFSKMVSFYDGVIY